MFKKFQQNSNDNKSNYKYPINRTKSSLLSRSTDSISRKPQSEHSNTNINKICYRRNYQNNYHLYKNNLFKQPQKLIHYSNSQYYPNNCIKLVCKTCINQNDAYKQKKILNEQENDKDHLNKCFNNKNPYDFQDKMNLTHQELINDKINKRNYLVEKLANKLEQIKKIPNEKEKLIYNNQYAVNELCFEKNDPRYERIKNNYDHKEKIIEKYKHKFNLNNPRKEIQDYYNKTQYDVPLMEPEHKLSDECKKYYFQTLQDQINEKKENKKKQEKEKIDYENQKNKQFNDYLKWYKNKENYNKMKNQKDLIENNEKLKMYKLNLKEEEEKNKKDYEKKLNDEIQREKENAYRKKLEKKFNDMNQLNKWFDEAREEKLKKKKKEDLEEIKWQKYKKDADKLCIHGCNLCNCAICNRILPKEKLYYYNVCKNKTSNFNKFNKNFGKEKTDLCNCGCNENISGFNEYNNNYYGKKKFFNNNYKFTNM